MPPKALWSQYYSLCVVALFASVCLCFERMPWGNGLTLLRLARTVTQLVAVAFTHSLEASCLFACYKLPVADCLFACLFAMSRIWRPSKIQRPRLPENKRGLSTDLSCCYAALFLNHKSNVHRAVLELILTQLLENRLKFLLLIDHLQVMWT